MSGCVPLRSESRSWRSPRQHFNNIPTHSRSFSLVHLLYNDLQNGGHGIRRVPLQEHARPVSGISFIRSKKLAPPTRMVIKILCSSGNRASRRKTKYKYQHKYKKTKNSVARIFVKVRKLLITSGFQIVGASSQSFLL